MATPPNDSDRGGEEEEWEKDEFAAASLLLFKAVGARSAHGNGPLAGVRRSSSVVGPLSTSGVSGEKGSATARARSSQPVDAWHSGAPRGATYCSDRGDDDARSGACGAILHGSCAP